VNPVIYENLPYDSAKDLAGVIPLGNLPSVLFVSPALGVKSAQELMAYARANPGKLNFGFGQGTAPQLVGEWFNRSNGLDIASVPYKGGMQAVTDMLGGTIHINIGVTATLLPLIREGKVRAIAVWSKTRHPELPEVPTMIESGFPGLSLGFWVGLWAPAGAPAAVIDKVNAAANTALRSPEMMASMTRLGVDGSPGSPQDFAAFIADEAPKWADIVKASGVKVD